jgi:hypothetical protein
VWFETTRPRPSVWRPRFSNSASASNRSLLFRRAAVPLKSVPMENWSIPNSTPATGRTSTPWSKRSRSRNSSGTLALRFLKYPWPVLVGRWTLDVERSAFSFFRRVKGAWWPSRSSKPSSAGNGRGRFDSYPLRQIIFDFRFLIFDWQRLGTSPARPVGDAVSLPFFCSGRRLGGKRKGGMRDDA